MTILPDYLFKKKIIMVGEFFEKKFKKNNNRKGIIFRELDDEVYYINENMNGSLEDLKKNEYYIEYLQDGIQKTIITDHFLNVHLNKKDKKGYVFNKIKNNQNKLVYYIDEHSYVDYFIYFLN